MLKYEVAEKVRVQMKITSKQIFYLILPEVHILDLTGPIHVFYEAQEYEASLQQYYLSAFKSQTNQASSAGLVFSNLSYYRDATPNAGDYLLIPGIDFKYLTAPDFRMRYQDQLKWIYDLHQKGVNICSICTGAFVLGHAKLLNHRDCTTHWKYCDRLQSKFPQAQVKKQRLFIEADRVYSSAGVSAGIDLSLHILEKEFSKKVALDVAREIVVYLRRNAEDPQLSPFLQYRNHMDERVQQVQDYIYQNIEQKLTITQLAMEVYVTPRHLSRIFKAATGLTILSYIQKLRAAQKNISDSL